jgi:hypothetical protein
VLYLTTPSTPQVRDAMTAGLIGAMDTPAQGNELPSGAPWAADNGCYGKGYPGDPIWLSWLASRPRRRGPCLFAVAPDVVADAAATLWRSAPHLPVIRAHGYRAALVAQNGLEVLEVPWTDFDVLFIGGDTAWKLGPHARRLAYEAKRRGKHVHMGRVNSLRRLRYAAAIGCDSADGTYVKWGPDINLPKVLGWVRDLDTQTALFACSPPLSTAAMVRDELHAIGNSVVPHGEARSEHHRSVGGDVA